MSNISMMSTVASCQNPISDFKLGCSGLREVQVSTVRVARPSTPSKEYIGEAGRRRNLLQFHPL